MHKASQEASSSDKPFCNPIIPQGCQKTKAKDTSPAVSQLQYWNECVPEVGKLWWRSSHPQFWLFASFCTMSICRNYKKALWESCWVGTFKFSTARFVAWDVWPQQSSAIAIGLQILLFCWSFCHWWVYQLKLFLFWHCCSYSQSNCGIPSSLSHSKTRLTLTDNLRRGGDVSAVADCFATKDMLTLLQAFFRRTVRTDFQSMCADTLNLDTILWDGCRTDWFSIIFVRSMRGHF